MSSSYTEGSPLARVRRVARWSGRGHRYAVVALALALPGAATYGGGEARPAGAAESGPAGAGHVETAEVTDPYAGIPQHGIVLGEPNAPLTLTEFADLQCPYCRQFDLEALPTLVQRYVRTGQMKIVFRALALVGPESKKAAEMAEALGLQDHLWQFADLFFRSQGAENSGYVTDDFVRRLASAVPGVDVRRAADDRTSPVIARQLEDAKRQADRFGIDRVPSFLLGKTGEQAHVLEVASLSPEPFTKAIDALLHAK